VEGLTEEEARKRLQENGPNSIPEQRRHPLRAFFKKFWAPVPWMLEAILLLEVALGHDTEAAIIALLLLVNATLSSIQEARTRSALDLLRARLALNARALRDGTWRVVPAETLVQGDVIYLRVGDLVPADVEIAGGQLLCDHSALTGESLPVEIGVGTGTFTGAVVRRGEATAKVTATGIRSFFGKTAELVRLAKSRGHFEELILKIVRALVALDIVLVAAVLIYAVAAKLPFAEVVPFALMVLVASVPVALPATFTLATALGSLELTRKGVLVTRLSAVEDAAAMDVLCTDKTGTITKNELTVVSTYALPGHTEDEVLRFAALASNDATQDPIDTAILGAARGRGLLANAPERLRFVPFEPALKRSQAFFRMGESTLHVAKGAPQVIASLDARHPDVLSTVEHLAAKGQRVLAVASGPEEHLELVGLIGLEDPPREDSKAVVARLQELGVRVVMVTGDGLSTARAVASEVGIGTRALPRDAITNVSGCPLMIANAFGGVFPEDKIHLVAALQRAGHVVGMTGDGVNDAPALRQAEFGVAVASATDVAKGAASVVLTSPGLAGVLDAIETSRRIYQRMLTYTMNKIVKTFHVSLLLGIGLLVTGVFVTTPRLILLLLLANDFVTISIATDRVPFSAHPDRWDVKALVTSALVLAGAWLTVSSTVFFLGRDYWLLDVPRLQTLVFVALVFTSQATVYLVRERRHFWSSAPGRWLVVGTVADLAVVTVLATRGILMAPLPVELVAWVLVLVIGALVLFDGLKIVVFEQLGVSERRSRRLREGCS
jgi:H+-transporting ATPase